MLKLILVIIKWSEKLKEIFNNYLNLPEMAQQVKLNIKILS